jgi:hypothetical protein
MNPLAYAAWRTGKTTHVRSALAACRRLNLRASAYETAIYATARMRIGSASFAENHIKSGVAAAIRRATAGT